MVVVCLEINDLLLQSLLILLQSTDIGNQIRKLLVCITVYQSFRHERTPSQRTLAADISRFHENLTTSHEGKGGSTILFLTKYPFHTTTVFFCHTVDRITGFYGCTRIKNGREQGFGITVGRTV